MKLSFSPRRAPQVLIEPLEARIAPASTAAFTDVDGDLFKVKVSGPGSATVTLLDPDHDGNGAIDSIVLAGTKTASILKISVTQSGGGNGLVDLGAITGGKLASVVAAKTNLTGAGASFSGGVGVAKFADLLNGADLVFGGAAAQLTALTLGAVGDGSAISRIGKFSAIAVASFGAGSISAAAISALNSAGRFAGDVTAVGKIGAVSIGGAADHAAFAGKKLGSLFTAGALSASLDFTGRIGAIEARGTAEGVWTAGSFGSVLVKRGSFSASIDATSLDSLKVIGGDLTGVVNALGDVGPITISSKGGAGGGLRGASLIAKNFGAIKVAGDVVNATVLAGASLGSDHTLGGDGPAADTFAKGKIAAFIVGGAVDRSTVAAGLKTGDRLLKNTDDSVVGGGGSAIGKFKVAGAASADSYFRAGKFSGAVRIGGVKIDTATDPRFNVTTIADTTAPTVAGALAHDTGKSITDKLTFDATISGAITEANQVGLFRAGLDATASANFSDVSSTLSSDGSFRISTAVLDALAGGTLADGAHTLHLVASDQNGNASPMTDVTFTLDRAAPRFTLGPDAGTDDVLPRELVFAEFSEPVVTGTSSAGVFTAGAQNVLALASVNGAVAGRTVIEGTGLRVTFVPTSDLQGNMEFTATLDAAHIFDGAGNAAMAVRGAKTDFRTVNNAGIPGTKVVGFVYDSAPGAGGANVPLPGAKVTLANAPAIQTTTDATGRFELNDVPSGKLMIDVDGHTVAVAAGNFYPAVAEVIEAAAGQTNTFPSPIFLPLAHGSDFVTVSNTPGAMTPVTNTAQLPGWKLMVPAGAVERRDGTVANQLLIAPVPSDRLPAPLPPSMTPAIVITIQTQGGADIFTTPVGITAPNLENLAPGAKTMLWDFDHARGTFVPVAAATVSADGMTITTDAGGGVIRPGWHFFQKLVRDTFRPVYGPGVDKPGFPDALAKTLASATAAVTDALSPLGLLGPEFAIPLALVGLGAGAARASFDGGGASTTNQIGSSLVDNGLIGGGGLAAGAGASLYGAGAAAARGGTSSALGALGNQLGALGNGLGALGSGLSFYNLLKMGGDLDRLKKDAADLKKTLKDPPGDTSAQIIGAVDALTLQIDGVLRDGREGVARMLEGFQAAYQINDLLNTLPSGSALPAPLRAQIAPLFDRMGERFASAQQLVKAIIPAEIGAAQQSAGLFKSAATLPTEGRVYYSYSIGGAVSKGSSVGAIGIDVAPGAAGKFTAVDPVTRSIGSVDFTVPQIGAGRFGLAPGAVFGALAAENSLDHTVLMLPSKAADANGNGLPDDLDAVLGSPTREQAAQLLQGLPATGLPLSGVVGKLNTSALDVAAGNGVAYLAAGSAGLQVVDLSRPGSPAIVGQAATESPATHVFARGALVAVTEQSGAVQVFDATQPSSPQLLVRVAGVAGDLAVLDGHSVVVADAGVLKSYDLFTGALIGQVTLPGAGEVEDLHLTNGAVFAIRHDTAAQQFTVSGTALGADGSLAAQGSVAFAGRTPIALTANLSGGDGVLFVGGISTDLNSAQPGFATVNIANPASLTLTKGTSAGLAVTDFAPDGGRLAISATRVVGAPVLDVFDVSNPANTGALVTTFPLSGEARAVAIAGGLGLAVDGAGLSVVRFTAADAGAQAPAVSITSPAGGDVVSGAIVPVHITATDDAQIAKVELILQGNNVVATDNSFPFDADFRVPAGIPAGTALSLVARATDTGGNVRLSAPIAFTTVADTAAPAVISSLPAANGVGANVAAITLSFSEAIDPALIDASAITLLSLGANGQPGGGDDAPVTLQNAALLAGRKLTVTPAAPLLAGAYQLSVAPKAVADLSGNRLAAPFTLSFTSTSTNASIFWSSNQSGAWNDPNNWSLGRVPNATDDVSISVPGSITVTYPAGNTTIKSLASDEALSLTGGALAVNAGVSHINGALTVGGGATLVATGATTTLIASAAATLTGANVFAQNGATLSLPGATNIGAANFNTSIEADSGGILNLPNLTTLHGASNGVVFVQALSGGKLNATALTTIPDGAAQVKADGTGSVIDFNALATFIDTTGFTSTLEARNGGNLKIPALTAPQNLQLILDGAASLMNTAQITSVTGDEVYAANSATLNLPGVAMIGGVNFNTVIQSSAGATLNFPNLTTLHGAANGVVFVQALTGGKLNATALTTIPDGAAQVKAEGTGSVIDFNALATFTDTTGFTSTLEARNGGNLKIPALTAPQNLQIILDGAASLMNTAQITSVNGDEVYAANSATLNLPGVAMIGGVNFNTLIQSSAGATLNFPNLTTLHGAANGVVFVQALTGGKLNATALTTIPDGAAQVKAEGTGSVIDFNTLAAFIDTTGFTSTLEARNGGNLKIPALTAPQNLQIILDGAASLMNTAQITSVNGDEVYAANSATLSLPGVAMIGGVNFNTVIQSSAGATLNFPNLTTLHGAANGVVFVQALTGGKLNATALTTIPDGAAQVKADGAGSVLDFGALATFTDTTGFNSTVEALNTGVVHLGTGAVTLSNLDVIANATLTAGTLTLGAGARLFGGGTITGNVANTAGEVRPGLSPGALTISGGYTQSAGGSLFLEIGGLTAGTQFDRLIIGGAATLAGTLNLSLVSGFVPDLGATFPVLTFTSRTGTFTTVTGTSIAAGKQFAAGYNAADVTLTVTP